MSTAAAAPIGRTARKAFAQFVRYHASHGTTAIAPTTAIGPVSAIEKSLAAITSVAAARRPGEAIVFGAHLEGPFVNPLKPGAMESSLMLEGDVDLARRWAERYRTRRRDRGAGDSRRPRRHPAR